MNKRERKIQDNLCKQHDLKESVVYREMFVGVRECDKTRESGESVQLAPS